ncbi:unnamed protein product [Rotaria sp. Silwood1]|nr:unnamed protein product [Rotaria sp. Silwood1]
MNEGDDDISVEENEDPAVLASPEALETSSFLNLVEYKSFLKEHKHVSSQASCIVCNQQFSVHYRGLVDLIDDTEETGLGSDNTNENLELQRSYTTAVDLFSIITYVRTKLQEGIDSGFFGAACRYPLTRLPIDTQNMLKSSFIKF